jgi:hypothetical protein
MIKKINLFILTLVIIFMNTQYAYAYVHKGWAQAEVLKIIFRKLEVCTGSNALEWATKEVSYWLNERALTDEFCNEPAIIADYDKEVDVGSVKRGRAAANYGDTRNLKFGKTYTHARLTVSRKFIIKNLLDENGKGIDTGGSVETSNCKTKTITDGMYGFNLPSAPSPNTWTEEVHKYDTIPVVDGADPDDTGPSEEMAVYYVNGISDDDPAREWSLSYTCFDEECGTGNLGVWWYCFLEEGCSSGLNKGAIGMSIPTDQDNFIPKDDIVLIFKLKKPYTVKEIAPRLKLSFGTKKGVAANEVGVSANEENDWVVDPEAKDGKCQFRMGYFHVVIEMRNGKKGGPKTGDWQAFESG